MVYEQPLLDMENEIATRPFRDDEVRAFLTVERIP